nr:CPBP family intramembrane glutamic endopeptidase [Anaeromonas gelatinilytica]
MIIISIFGELLESPLPSPSSGGSYIIGLFVIAITPGICEEFMFRGFLMRCYDNKGYKKAILISSVLFGLMHFNIQNLLGPIFLGVLFGFLVYRTNSLFAGIIGHITNNGFAWTLTYIISSSDIPMEQTEEVGMQISETMSIIISAVFLLAIALVTGIFAYKLYKKLPNRQLENLHMNNEENQVEIIDDIDESKDIKINNIFKYMPVIVIMIIYIYLHMILYI